MCKWGGEYNKGFWGKNRLLNIGIELDNVHDSDTFYEVMLAVELGVIIFSILLILACLLCTSERIRHLKT